MHMQHQKVLNVPELKVAKGEGLGQDRSRAAVYREAITQAQDMISCQAGPLHINCPLLLEPRHQTGRHHQLLLPAFEIINLCSR